MDRQQLKHMDYQHIYDEAHAAGMAAGAAAQVEPMFLVDPTSGASYIVDDGVCGFASVRVPARGFGKWAVDQKIAYRSAYGGAVICCMEFNQSLTRKEAYARAFAEVLRGHGISKARSESRID